MMRRLPATLAVAALAALAMAAQASTSAVTTPARTAYVVQRGDTLSSIASRFGTTPRHLATTNGIRNPNVVVAGTRLTVPHGSGSHGGHEPGVLPAKLRAHPDRLALRPLFERWANHYGVPADLLESIAWIESGWQTGVVSRTGAIGVGQLQPATIDVVARMIGIPLDPRSANDNIRMSARFLRYLLDRTGNNVPVTVAAYYQGLRSVTSRPTLPDTKHYVEMIVAVRPAFE